MSFVAEVVDQVVVVIADDWPQNPWQLARCNLKVLRSELSSDDGLPDVVLELEDMPDQPALIAALVAFIVLEQSHEVSRLQSDGQESLRGVPLSLALGDPDVAVDIVLLP